MKRLSTLGVLVAGAAFALAPAAFAQTNQTPPGHTASPTEPGFARNDPDRGATDPARVGTMTTGTQDKNNNRNPPLVKQTTETTETQITTSPTTTYETATPVNTTYTETVPPPAPAPVQQTVTTLPATLPRTASTTPLAAGIGFVALGGALALRSRRLFA